MLHDLSRLAKVNTVGPQRHNPVSEGQHPLEAVFSDHYGEANIVNQSGK
jgi:hypothetical protein